MKAAELSIIIPTYSRKDKLLRCLDVLLSQDYLSDKYEIIVVDDGSTDGTEEAVTSLNNPRITYIKQQNKGAGAAINAGAKVAKGEILAFLNDDCTVENDWVNVIIGLFNRYPQATAFAGECIDLFYGEESKQNISHNHDGFKKMRLDKISTHIGNGSFAIKNAAFKELGGYDESFYVQEDCEFNIRLLKHGYEVLIGPGLRAIHNTNHNIVNVFKKEFNFGTWEASLVKKHLPKRLSVHFCTPLFGIDRLLSMPFPISVFIKVYMAKIFIFLLIFSFFYPIYAFSIIGLLLIVKTAKYALKGKTFFSIICIFSDYIIKQAALSAGNMTGSIKNKAIIF